MSMHVLILTKGFPENQLEEKGREEVLNNGDLEFLRIKEISIDKFHSTKALENLYNTNILEWILKHQRTPLKFPI